tara:strand:- start:504 stop:611 length:108 start_codon:yes stop_codon:yes gene_type:complete
MAFGKKTIYQVAADKSGSTGYETTHLLFRKLRKEA